MEEMETIGRGFAKARLSPIFPRFYPYNPPYTVIMRSLPALRSCPELSNME